MRAALALAGVVLSLAMASAAQQASPRVSPYAPIRILLDGARKPGDCADEGKRLQRELADLRFPAGWTLAIMCTAVRWETILQQVNPPYTHDAFTRRSSRITVLNGALFREFPARYRHVLAHELAHIQCDCGDENKVEQLAHRLSRSSIRTLAASSAAATIAPGPDERVSQEKNGPDQSPGHVDAALIRNSR